MYSYKIEQAVRAASVLHQDQLRKGSVPIPYISHLISVSYIVSDYTKDENVIVAALLHDTLEDTDYTEEEMLEDFGGPVTELVRYLTEPTHHKNGEKMTWLEKKQSYVKQLKDAPEEALIIAAADKSHNFRTIIEEYHDGVDRFVKDFGPYFEKKLEAYQAMANVLNSRLKNDIVHEFNHTFTEFKEFLLHAEKKQNEF